jgi:hypothetical protein
MASVGSAPSEQTAPISPSDAAAGTSYYGDAATSSVGTPQDHTDNRFNALFEAGSNIQQNNANNLTYKQADQAYAMQRETLGFERDKYALGMQLQNRTIDLNEETVKSQATLTNTHAAALAGIQEQMATLDMSDPQYQRKLAALTNSFATMSQLAAQSNANVTTYTSRGHGSLQTAQSGSLGSTSTTTGQTIDAGVATAEISSGTQLGLADRKVVLDTTLAGTQAGVAIHHTDKVGAPVAQGQGNYFTGLGSNTAGFTSGSNVTGNFNGQYGFGYAASPMMGGFPPPTQPTLGTAPATATIPNGNVLSGQIQSLMGS